jgi:hypothetical protein
MLAVWVGVPVGMGAAILLGARRWWDGRGQYELAGLYEWTDVALSLALMGLIVVVGCGLAAWLYRARREHAAFGTLVVMMWAAWLYAWPNVMPKVMSQQPFIDFARQLADPQCVPLEARAHLRQIANQDSRITWYSDLRFPRLIDQLDLLNEQRERWERGEQATLRDLEYEKRRYGEEMIAQLNGDAPILMVAAFMDYMEFVNAAPDELAATDEPWPPVHLWLQTRCGTEKQHFVLFGNKPPPFKEPELQVRPEIREGLTKKGLRLRWPTTRPADEG